MRHFLLLFCIIVNYLPNTLSQNEEFFDFDFESVFGKGAEDNEENFVLSLNGFVNPGDNAIKSTREDPEDVEMFLSSGPMVAPDIILKGFVDSRVSLTNMMEDAAMNKMSTPMLEMDNSIMDDEDKMASDDLLDYEHQMVNYSAKPFNEFELKENLKPLCMKKYEGSFGGFNLSFDGDCITEISSPDPNSRVMLTCSPIPLGDCATYKDALAINVIGDTAFKQNSFMYCGYDANIRAISIRNKLAIRVKKTDAVSGSTFCTFHSRVSRQVYADIAVEGGEYPCGRLGRLGKIVGGRRVPPGLFPWAVQLDITRVDGTQTGCTATIVSPHYVLTAAHCMKRAESVSAFMGGTDRHDILGSELLIQAEKYILHRKWSSRTLVADIALVKLTEPIQYSEDISPICLPEGRLLSEDMSGKRGVAIGWGRTETKKKAPRRLYRVKLPLLTDSYCKDIYRRFYIPKVMMCTDSKKDAAICYGMPRNYSLNLLQAL